MYGNAGMKKVFASWNRWMDLEKTGGLNIHLKKETDRASNYNQLIPGKKLSWDSSIFE